ncbi:LacI family transcriptional regulator [Paenibacillus forsythiae]|uniref:LacI family transcriptional regulator n=1 Tax=Paenibacillus forsythiae TaxID=365616 RepID=A0ABU3H3F7_9BACL|nr:LacI family DNA-binding transcriptional regulator [Paenibacillus forsythiae]MDT3425354.1 LacI family transcriptional regulator [Paenibacillus forsythiae]
MRKEKVTLADLAEALGTSTVSISRALSGQPGISEELKRRILSTAKEMGYRKGKKGESPRILLLHQDPYIHDSNNFSAMYQGLEKVLQEAEADYDAEYVDKETQTRLQLPYKMSKETDFDGVIMLGRFNIPYAHFIHEQIPNLIFFTGYSPAYNYDSVWFSFLNAGYKLGEYLMDHGHRTIGFLGSKGFYRNKEKMLGLSIVLEEHGLPVREDLFLDTEADYQERLLELIRLNSLPTAFICDHDFTALELIKFLHSRKLSVPADVSVIGSGNTELSKHCIPPLTTMDMNIRYSCEAVVATLLKRIAKPDKPGENIAIISTLVERESVSAPPLPNDPTA